MTPAVRYPIVRNGLMGNKGLKLRKIIPPVLKKIIGYWNLESMWIDWARINKIITKIT